jgi:hypothetical protein
MYLTCPVCNHVNLFCEISIPYYICKKCRFGEKEYFNYRYNRTENIEQYHFDFWNAVKKIEEEKEVNSMIKGVL